MKIMQKIREFMTPVDDGEYDEYGVQPGKYEMQGTGLDKFKNVHLIIHEPRSFDIDAEQIALNVKAGRGAIVNLHRLSKEDSQRMIDFLYGVVFALDGKLEKVGNQIILLTPATITVEIAEDKEKTE